MESCDGWMAVPHSSHPHLGLLDRLKVNRTRSGGSDQADVTVMETHAAEHKEQTSINTELHPHLRGQLGGGPPWPPPPSYRRGAAVGGVGVAGVLQLLLDAVVDLQEVVIPL